MKCRTVIWGSVATVGIVLIAAGIALTQIGSDIVEDLVHEKLSLMDETSDGYKYFVRIKSFLNKIILFLPHCTDHSAHSCQSQLHILSSDKPRQSQRWE